MKIFLLILILIFFNQHVYSKNLFKTSFHEIEFISDNIENQKIKEINKIKIKSIKNVLEKTLTNENYNILIASLSEDLINTFIKNIIIEDEKIINDKYFSKIRINFEKKKIVNYYRKNNIPYVEYHPNNLLLIINEDNEIKNSLFSKNNNFYIYFLENLKNHDLFKIPNLDINDRFILNEQDLKNKNLKKIKNFAKKYNINEVIIIFAKINKNSAVYDLLLLSNERIVEKRLKYNKLNYEIFYKHLENESLNFWKDINKIQNNSINIINCKIDYFNILELKEIKNKLNSISLISKIDTKSLSYQNIEYDIYYYGSLKILINLFKLTQLQIDESDTFCKIKLI